MKSSLNQKSGFCTLRPLRSFISTSLICSLGLFSFSASAFQVQVADAPDSNLTLTVSAIESAQRSIFLNIYELSSPQITDALLGRIRAGVHVEILQEGQIVGGLSTAGRGIQTELAQAMRAARGSGDRLFEMTSKGAGGATTSVKRRYRFDHAKYAVIDDNRLLIGSENYSPTGNNVPGTIGNRGWEVFIQDPSIAAEYKKVFETDINLSSGDVLDITAGNSTLLSDSQLAEQNTVGDLVSLNASSPGVSRSTATPSLPVMEASAVERITSPDLSLSGLVAMMNGARHTLDIQQMTFEYDWGGPGTVSPLYDAAVTAARRGVAVRVLLNDEVVFNHSSKPAKPKNGVTIEALNQQASREKLNLIARTANLKAMGVDYIHNKGALVDADRTLISSINWVQNSVVNNREAAVLITSPAVHGFYQALFDRDWNASGQNAFTLSTLAAVDEETIKKECPESLEVSARIAKLSISDKEDEEFATLSGRTIEGVYTRNTSHSGCILTEKGEPEGTSKKRYIEVRHARDGSISLILEGYTAEHSKLYSVRARLGVDEAIVGDHVAGVYDGSGPSRERLGPATLSLKVTPPGK